MIQTLRKIWQFSGSKKSVLAKSLIASILNAVFESLQFVAIMIALQTILGNQTVSHPVAITSLIMLVSILGKAATGYFSNQGMTEAGYYMCAEKRTHIADLMKYVPMGYFNETSMGNITAVLTSVMGDIENTAPRSLILMFGGFIQAVIVSAALLFFDVRIGLIMLVGIVCFLFATSLYNKRVARNAPKKQEAQTALVKNTMEFLGGIGVIKSFGLKGRSAGILRSIQNSTKETLRLEYAIVPFTMFQELILYVFDIVIIALAVRFYFSGTMVLADCLLMVVAAFMVYSSLLSAGNMVAALGLMGVAMEQVEALNNTPRMDLNGKEISAKNTDISLSGVSFSYGYGETLHDVTLDIPAGSFTAVVGPSGSGKSTLCHLISRFWDVDKGSIKLGGTDVRDYTLDSLLANVSMVFQNVYLFQDTVANNIRFGKPDATMEEVESAAKAACCHDFITALPNGYNTVIGEGGSTLSGGERQRISIARAILKDAPVIILDEATSNIDPENERQLQMAIESLTKEKTVIMIAHRLKTIRNADQIIVLNRGQIVQRGTHKELLAQQGIYTDFIAIREKTIGWKLK